MLSGEVARRYGHDGLPDDTIHIQFKGTAGQSFGAFLARGVTLDLVGDGQRLRRQGPLGRPDHHPADHRLPRQGRRQPSSAAIPCCMARSRARPSSGASPANASRSATPGATAVVEGTGDHGCEYMTGGTVVVLGETGRNFAAGMSGGVAYVLRSGRHLRREVQQGDGRARRGAADRRAGAGCSTARCGTTARATRRSCGT